VKHTFTAITAGHDLTSGARATGTVIKDNWVRKEFDECEILLEGYCCFRADRGFKTKGKPELLAG